MRRLHLLTLVCAVLGLAALGPPALAATHGHRHHTATTAHTHRVTHTKTTSSHTRTSSSSRGGGGKSTAAAGNRVLNDCQSHGQLTRSYTRAELRQALAEMSATTKQYSNCYNVVQQALLHVIKGSGGSSGGGSSSSTTIIVIIVVVLLVLAAIFGGLAVRRRRGDDGPADGPPATG